MVGGPSLQQHYLVRLVLDNAATYKTGLIHRRLAVPHLHLTPTSASWLNLVERWFTYLPAASYGVAPSASMPGADNPPTKFSATEPPEQKT